MELKIDAHAGALYFRLREGRVHETRPLMDFQVIADLDENGVLLGIEVLDVPTRVDEFGYAHVDVALTTSEGRTIELEPEGPEPTLLKPAE